MQLEETELPGVVIIEPQVFSDKRGFFMETFQAQEFKKAGIDAVFLQDNLSKSGEGTVRGLHYQYPHSQGKLINVVQGSVFDVAVDIRKGSASFGKWFWTEISEENKRILWIPPGFAHGFCVTTASAVFSYKCTDYYVPEFEHTILWNDPDIAINWPVKEPILSPKDLKGLPLKNVDRKNLPG